MKLEEVIRTDRFKDEIHKATINLMYTAYWYKTNVSGVLKQSGITAEQFNVMRILKGKHPTPMCIKDIAGRMIEKNSNVPRIVDRLLDKEFVKRSISDEDRRETLIALTDTGITLLTEASNMLDEATTNLLGITNEEAAQLNTLLEKMRTKNL